MPWITFDPVASSVVALLCAWMAVRYLLKASPRWHFAAQAAIFACLTLLQRAYDIAPFDVMAPSPGHPARRVVGAAIEIAWWLVAAQLVRRIVRVFLRLGNREREVTLVQEMLGASIYLVAVIAILTYVFNLPIKGLLATSGALAIVVGLALQSSLGDAFSGIVLNLERPYRVGDWIFVDETVQGYVLETNWRTTHIRTSSNDLAIVPNSVIAKSKIVNCSEPTPVHSASVCVRLDRALAPEEAQDLLKDVLLGGTGVVHSGESAVLIRDVSAESVSYELGFVVSDIRSVDAVKSEILRRAFYAAGIAGSGFAPEVGCHGHCESRNQHIGRRCVLSAISLFNTLTAAERDRLLDGMVRRVHPAGSVVASGGTVMQVLVIVRRGVLVAWERDGADSIESTRFTPGLYVGEMGVLTGEPLGGSVTALTHVVTYEISKEALAPILRARPAVADQLGETLELWEQSRLSVLNQHRSARLVEPTIVGRVAETIRHLFALH
jgi:small-conductance mechanosensitive channel/CRP-like cAMP-binding protein